MAQPPSACTSSRRHRRNWRSHEGSRTPILTGVADWFVGAIRERVDAGDHVVFIVDPVDAESNSGPSMVPLRLGSVGWIDPGHDA